ncbi:MAG: hypothetical protein P4M08_15200 [Oligoflexia bacterium]|nr:hypothetical protein [Oligoflexia bacterium]
MSWNSRTIHYEHEHQFEKILQLHRLTEAWVDALKEVTEERPSHFLNRGLSRDMADALWRLESLSQERLEDLLDDTSTDDVLSRLDHTVWSVQAYTLAKLLERANSSAPLKSVLEQTSWKLGRNCAEKRWSELNPLSRKNVAELVLALNDTPFGNDGVLMIRITAREAHFEMLRCAHQQSSNEVRSVADALCGLHAHWLKGFAYGLNPAVGVETIHCTTSSNLESGSGPTRCHCRWTLAELTPSFKLDQSVSR